MKLFFHLFFFRFAALQHLDFRDVNGALVGIDIGFHLYMVAFMALECLRIVDGPGLLVLVCNEGDFVAVYLDRAVDALQRSLGSLIFLRRLLGWILRKRGHAKDDSEGENDRKQRFHGSTSLTSSSMVPQTWIERDLLGGLLSNDFVRGGAIDVEGPNHGLCVEERPYHLLDDRVLLPLVPLSIF